MEAVSSLRLPAKAFSIQFVYLIRIHDEGVGFALPPHGPSGTGRFPMPNHGVVMIAESNVVSFKFEGRAHILGLLDRRRILIGFNSYLIDQLARCFWASRSLIQFVFVCGHGRTLSRVRGCRHSRQGRRADVVGETTTTSA